VNLEVSIGLETRATGCHSIVHTTWLYLDSNRYPIGTLDESLIAKMRTSSRNEKMKETSVPTDEKVPF
jgi:hypothetical protein